MKNVLQNEFDKLYTILQRDKKKHSVANGFKKSLKVSLDMYGLKKYFMTTCHQNTEKISIPQNITQ